MSDGKQFALLLESLRSHDISLNSKDLRKALDTQNESSMETWVDEHLGPETLLTKEELSLQAFFYFTTTWYNTNCILRYSALQKSGESEVLASSQDLSLLRGISDDDLQSAIEQLQKSTIAIEKHTEILRTQQEAVAILVKANGQNHTVRLATENTQFRAWTTENNQTRSAASDILRNEPEYILNSYRLMSYYRI